MQFDHQLQNQEIKEGHNLQAYTMKAEGKLQQPLEGCFPFWGKVIGLKR